MLFVLVMRLLFMFSAVADVGGVAAVAFWCCSWCCDAWWRWFWLLWLSLLLVWSLFL